MCPDTVDSRGTCSNNVLGVRGVTTSRQQCVSFSRPFTTGEEGGRDGREGGRETNRLPYDNVLFPDDADCDLPIDPTNEEQYIVWGVGPLGETAFRHFSRSGSKSTLVRARVIACVPQDVCSSVLQEFSSDMANMKFVIEFLICPSLVV